MSVTNIKYTRKKLKNGLEVVLAPMPKNPTVTAIILFKIGSRYENEKYAGISHFLEHIVFKGNKLYRTPQELAAAIDALGGSFNAFTSKEFTGFHIKLGSEFLEIALRWLGQLVTTPLIPINDVETERKVILEEINMYNDTPTAQIGYIFEELIFPKSPLGRNIIGSEKSLREIKQGQLVDHFEKNYLPTNAVLAIAGDLSGLKDKKNSLDEYFKFRTGCRENIRNEDNPNKQGKNLQKVRAVYKKTDQTHLVLGAKTFSYLDKRRYPLALISTIMGGGMSSWAFSEIREKRGLAYYVRSSTELHKDTGSYSINAGLNNEKLELAVKEIIKLFGRARNKLVSLQELKKAKDHLIGGMLLERETSEDIASLIGSEIAIRGKVTPFSEEVRMIRSVSRTELKLLAERLFAPDMLFLAFIGPWKKKDEQNLAKLIK